MRLPHISLFSFENLQFEFKVLSTINLYNYLILLYNPYIPTLFSIPLFYTTLYTKYNSMILEFML